MHKKIPGTQNPPGISFDAANKAEYKPPKSVGKYCVTTNIVSRTKKDAVYFYEKETDFVFVLPVKHN
jgi:hypothetical protein